jgi:hypothetical protein
MTEMRSTDDQIDFDDDDFAGYMGYGDGAILSVSEREGGETLMNRGEHVTVRENLEEALRQWLNYVFGSEANGDSEPEGEGV